MQTKFLLEAEKFPPLETYVRETLPARIFPAGEVLAYSNYGTALAATLLNELVACYLQRMLRKIFFNH